MRERERETLRERERETEREREREREKEQKKEKEKESHQYLSPPYLFYFLVYFLSFPAWFWMKNSIFPQTKRPYSVFCVGLFVVYVFE